MVLYEQCGDLMNKCCVLVGMANAALLDFFCGGPFLCLICSAPAGLTMSANDSGQLLPLQNVDYFYFNVNVAAFINILVPPQLYFTIYFDYIY